MYLVRIEIPKFMKPFLVVLSIGRVGYLYRYLTLGSYTYETFVQNFSHMVGKRDFLPGFLSLQDFFRDRSGQTFNSSVINSSLT